MSYTAANHTFDMKDICTSVDNIITRLFLSLKDLKSAEIAWLIRFCDISDRKLNLNLSKEDIARRFSSHLRGDAKEMLNRLLRKGYFYPHGGRNTFMISGAGVDKAEEYKRQMMPE